MGIDNKLLQATLAGVVSVGLSLTANQALAAKAPKMEKCYGVAKARKNDCGTKTHACAGLAKINNDPSEWVFVPTGTCIKMGGKLQPAGANSTSTPASAANANPPKSQ